ARMGRGWFGMRASGRGVATVEPASLAGAVAEEHEVGTKRLGEPHRLIARTCETYHGDPFVFEQAARLLAEARTIVDDQAAQGPHESSIAARRARSHGG